MEHQDGTLLRAEFLEAALELISIRDEPGLVTNGRPREGRERHFDGPPSPAPECVAACVDGQAMEPGVEPEWVTQARKITPGPDVGLLDRVSRKLMVSEDEAGDCLQLRDGRADEQSEGVMIASTCSLDEIPLVHGHPCDAPIRPRSRLMASVIRKPFPIGQNGKPRVARHTADAVTMAGPDAGKAGASARPT
jgi:hypothetical protein